MSPIAVRQISKRRYTNTSAIVGGGNNNNNSSGMESDDGGDHAHDIFVAHVKAKTGASVGSLAGVIPHLQQHIDALFAAKSSNAAPAPERFLDVAKGVYALLHDAAVNNAFAPLIDYQNAHNHAKHNHHHHQHNKAGHHQQEQQQQAQQHHHNQLAMPPAIRANRR
jgi:hypothetical protein